MPSHPVLFKGSLPQASDNLQATFSYLPLEDIYRAQRVCKFWRTTIAWSTHLQERMFIKASHYCHPIPRWHTTFNGSHSLVSMQQAPFVVNPIVERTWILPDPEDFRTDVDNFTLSPAGYDAELVKCFNDLPQENLLAFKHRPDLFGSIRYPPTKVGLGQCGSDGEQIFGRLDDIEERDFFHPAQIYWNKSALLSRSPKGVPTASWLNMLLTQPPVTCVGVKHPVMPTSWIVRKGCGVRIGHVLDALRKMLGVLPRPLQEHYLSESSNQIEMVVWFAEAEPEWKGKLAVLPDGSAPVMRPMKAKLRLAVKEIEGPVKMCCSGM